MMNQGLSAHPKPKFCTRCKGPLVEAIEPRDFDPETGKRRLWHYLVCIRLTRPWWRRLGCPATYHDMYLIFEYEGRVTYNLAEWR